MYRTTEIMSTKFESKNYNSIREQKEWIKNPDWETLLKEILQNIPFSELLRNILITVTKLNNPNGRDFTLEVIDDDYGCSGDDYEASLLKEETKNGFSIKKTADNKNGQGTQNFPNKTSDGKVLLQMKKDGICTQITMTGDENRTRIHEVISETDCKIKSPSGFYIKLNLSVPSLKKKISSAEDVVELIYKVVKKDLFSNFGTVDVKFELNNFDNATISKYNDRDNIQALKTPYYSDKSCTDWTMEKPYEENDVRILLNTNGDEIYISHVKLAKRIGQQDCIKKFGITQEQHDKEYDAAEYGDKPRVRLISLRTGLPYYEGTFPNSGKSNRNGADIDMYFDMSDDIWSDGSQTKNPFIQKGGLLEERLIEKAIEMWEVLFPSEHDNEDALQLFCFEKFTSEKLTKSVKEFFESIPSLAFLATCSYKKRLQHIKREDKNGHNRFDFSFRDINDKKIPFELKPKAFKLPDFRQVLDYYIVNDEDVNDVVMIGCDVDIQKITDFNSIVKTWKDGKMDSDATFTYIDATYEFDYDSTQKVAYIKKAQSLKKSK